MIEFDMCARVSLRSEFICCKMCSACYSSVLNDASVFKWTSG